MKNFAQFVAAATSITDINGNTVNVQLAQQLVPTMLQIVSINAVPVGTSADTDVNMLVGNAAIVSTYNVNGSPSAYTKMKIAAIYAFAYALGVAGSGHTYVSPVSATACARSLGLVSDAGDGNLQTFANWLAAYTAVVVT